MNQNIQRSFRKNLVARVVMYALLFAVLSITKSYSQTQTQTPVYANVSTYIKGYYESLPVDYKTNTTRKYPLLIFLHGTGEKGNGTTQLPLLLKNGPPKLINEGKFPSSFTVGGKQHSFIVISPQFSSTSDYVTAIYSVINLCKTKYRVDETKIYLTGLSLGGLLTWNLCGSSQKTSEVFAAILTVCGGGVPTEGRVDNVANAKLPVWVTNNSGDPYNPASRAEETVRLLNAHVPAPPKARLTIFQKAGHDAWTATYDPNFRQDGLSVYEWMLSYSRGSSATPAPPPPPVAEAGANQAITLPTSSVTLDGSKSTVASGYTIKTYAWTKVSGPTSGVITTPAGKTTTVTGLVAGTYVFQLKVTDSNGNTDTDTVTITVNAALTSTIAANAGVDKTVTLPTRSVALDGTKSVASAGSTIKTYAWSKVSGPINSTFSTTSGSTTTVSNLVPGTYVFQLKVTDAAGKTASDNVTVNVKYIVGTLKANAGADQTFTYPLAASPVLNGGASTAPTDAKVSCAWKRLSGPGSYGAVMYPSGNLITTTAKSIPVGKYEYQLTVQDDKGNVSTDVMVFTVQNATSAETSPPTAEAGANQTLTLPTNSVTIDAGTSTASSGTSISSYQWTKTSGPSSGTITSTTSAKTTVTSLVAGTYVFQVLVTDNKGKTDTDVVSVTVNAATTTVLKASAGADQTITLPARTVTLNGTQSTAASGYSIKSYKWSKVSGPTYSGGISNSTASSTSITELVPGTYVFRLTITDNAGKTATDDIKVIVKYIAGTLKANAGADQTFTYPLATSPVLNGGASTAPTGSTVSCAWKRISGPGTAGSVMYPSGNLITTTSKGLSVGTHQFQLTVRDALGNESKDILVITVKSSVSARTASTEETVSAQNGLVTADDLTNNQGTTLEVKINPNPVTTDMKVWVDGTAKGKTSIQVYNLGGALLLQQSFVKDAPGIIGKSFNVANLSAGTYLVKVVVDNKITKSVQMIKK
ncbi:MAG: PKD domain-containing protein [Agriterribacter sp.]